ncbi:hypothetical protein K438DRAFT_1772784 [Mycena galopus ATCC 62051]|nr:hypothetical protein K438DRAFT_1772784 [Mycena galopus ATCC 62051]
MCAGHGWSQEGDKDIRWSTIDDPVASRLIAQASRTVTKPQLWPKFGPKTLGQTALGEISAAIIYAKICNRDDNVISIVWLRLPNLGLIMTTPTIPEAIRSHQHPVITYKRTSAATEKTSQAELTLPTFGRQLRSVEAQYDWVENVK